MKPSRLCFAAALIAFVLAAISAFGHGDLNVAGFQAAGLALLALGSLL